MISWVIHNSCPISPHLSVQFEQRDVVVERLRVVVVVDVGGGDTQRLCALGAVLGGQVVVADPHVDGVTGPHDAA